MTLQGLDMLCLLQHCPSDSLTVKRMFLLLILDSLSQAKIRQINQLKACLLVQFGHAWVHVGCTPSLGSYRAEVLTNT